MRHDQQKRLQQIYEHYTSNPSLNALVSHSDLQMNLWPQLTYLLKLMVDDQYLDVILQIDQLNGGISPAEMSSFMFIDAAKNRCNHSEIVRVSFNSVVKHNRQKCTPPFGTSFELWARTPPLRHLVHQYLPLCPPQWREQVELGLICFFARERGCAADVFPLLEHFTITPQQVNAFLTWIAPSEAIEIIGGYVEQSLPNANSVEFFNQVLQHIGSYIHTQNPHHIHLSPHATGYNRPLISSDIERLHTLQDTISSRLQHIMLQKQVDELGESSPKRKL